MTMTGIGFSIGGIFAFLMLLTGIVLTVITMIRMRSGKITLPRWGKFLLSAAMITMLVILVLGMLPPDVIEVKNPFVEEHTHIVSPSAPESIEAAP